MGDRELDAQGGHLLSPLTSRAASPVISPLQAPALPPGVDELTEFSLDGAEGDEGEFGLLDGPAGVEDAIEFKLNGVDGLVLSPSNTPKVNAPAKVVRGVNDNFSLDG